MNDIVVGSFNLCKWGKKDTEKSLDRFSDWVDSDNNEKKGPRKSLYKLANIIKKEEFDIVALQEVFGLGEWLDSFCNNHLMGSNTHWDYRCSKPLDGSNECLAFIWNTDKFELSKEKKNKNNPRVIDDINANEIKRRPYLIRLTPKKLPQVEIRLINVHLLSNESSVAKRKNEYEIVIKELNSILQKESNKIYNSKTFYTFVLGDYNLTLKQLGQNYQIEFKNGTTKIINKQNQPTTLANNSQNIRQIYTENDYDHFSYGEACIHDSNVNPKRVDAVEKYFGMDERDEYKNAISDHVPIKLTLDIR